MERDKWDEQDEDEDEEVYCIEIYTIDAEECDSAADEEELSAAFPLLPPWARQGQGQRQARWERLWAALYFPSSRPPGASFERANVADPHALCYSHTNTQLRCYDSRFAQRITDFCQIRAPNVPADPSKHTSQHKRSIAIAGQTPQCMRDANKLLYDDL